MVDFVNFISSEEYDFAPSNSGPSLIGKACVVDIFEEALQSSMEREYTGILIRQGIFFILTSN